MFGGRVPEPDSAIISAGSYQPPIRRKPAARKRQKMLLLQSECSRVTDLDLISLAHHQFMVSPHSKLLTGEQLRAKCLKKKIVIKICNSVFSRRIFWQAVQKCNIKKWQRVKVTFRWPVRYIYKHYNRRSYWGCGAAAYLAQRTQLVCWLRELTKHWRWTLHTLTDLSSEAVTSLWPSWEKATLRTAAVWALNTVDSPFLQYTDI